MSTLEWGAVCLVVGFVLYFLGKLPKVQVILAFIGTCIVTDGLFGGALTRLADWAERGSDALTSKLFGTAIPGLLVIVLAVFFVHDLLPKNKASKRTFFIGIALAACLVAGLSSIQALNNVPASVRSSVGNASTIGG